MKIVREFQSPNSCQLIKFHLSTKANWDVSPINFTKNFASAREVTIPSDIRKIARHKLTQLSLDVAGGLCVDVADELCLDVAGKLWLEITGETSLESAGEHRASTANEFTLSD
jgi:hypothetical protein